MAGDKLHIVLLRGDHSLNEVKVGKLDGLADFRFAREDEIRAFFNCPPGFLGAVGIARDQVRIIADRSVATISDFVMGANQAKFHTAGINWGRDLPEPDIIADVRNVISGDASPDGKGTLEICRGIDCLQMGIGGIPNAVLAQLHNHKDLGVHSEMFSDGILPLVEKGIVTGKYKNIDKGKMVACFLMGSKALYDFVDDNPRVAMMDVEHTNNVAVIRKLDRVTAINSCLAIDITGQVCADSIGTKHYSGVGGQIDFIRGAGHSKGGKPIIALPSVTTKGVSKICPTLIEGSGVVSTRANIHWVVTEHGAVNLYGKTMQERGRLLISIAHPAHREALEKAAFERYGSHFHFVKDSSRL